MTRITNQPSRVDRIEATPFGLALVKGEPIRAGEARQVLAEIERQVNAIEAAEKKT